jgi:hypothetical protein
MFIHACPLTRCITGGTQSTYTTSVEGGKLILSFHSFLQVIMQFHSIFITCQFHKSKSRNLSSQFTILMHVIKSHKPISLHSYHKTKLIRITKYFRSKNRSRRYRTLSPERPFWRLRARNVLQTARQQGPIARAPILSPGHCDSVQNCQITGLCRLGASHRCKTGCFLCSSAWVSNTGVVYYLDHKLSCRPPNWVNSVANES